MRRRSWDSLDPAKDMGDARTRFGDEFVDSVVRYKENDEDIYHDTSVFQPYFEQYKTKTPRLYRGVGLDEPLQVGDVYRSTGLDSWSEYHEPAATFAERYQTGWKPEFTPSTPTVLHLEEPTEGLFIDRVPSNYQPEWEWLLDGDYEVVEDLGVSSGRHADIHNLKVRRAWDKGEPAQTYDEAVERFGREFTDVVWDYKSTDLNYGQHDTSRLRPFYDKYREPTTSDLYRGVSLDQPLQVGDTYSSTDLDSWTESLDWADSFAAPRMGQTAPHPTILHLNEPTEGLWLDSVPTDHADEREWLLSGDYRVVEDLGVTSPTGYGGNSRHNLRVERVGSKTASPNIMFECLNSGSFRYLSKYVKNQLNALATYIQRPNEQRTVLQIIEQGRGSVGWVDKDRATPEVEFMNGDMLLAFTPSSRGGRGPLVGFIQYDRHNYERIIAIKRMAVDVACRGQGIGREMVAELRRWFPNFDVEVWWVENMDFWDDYGLEQYDNDRFRLTASSQLSFEGGWETEGYGTHTETSRRVRLGAARADIFIFEDSPTTLGIGNMYVPDSERGKGLGAALSDAIDDWARQNGYTQIDIYAEPQAIGFWEKMGYHKAEGRQYRGVTYMTKEM